VRRVQLPRLVYSMMLKGDDCGDFVSKNLHIFALPRKHVASAYGKGERELNKTE